MILKKADDRSTDLAQLKLLQESSPQRFHAAIEKQMANIRIGLAGEKTAAHFLDREFGQSERVAVLHDLRIGVDGDFAQIDHLVIHRVQQTAWVLETKNYSGRLSCDDHGDWTVWNGKHPQPIASPINQARRQCTLLRQWLQEHGISTVREINPVVLISPTSSVNRSKLRADDHVVKADNFVRWFEEQASHIGVGTALGMLGRHLLNRMSQSDCEALGRLLANAHVPATFDWRARLRLPQPAVAAEALSAALPESSDATSADAHASLSQTIATAYGDIVITGRADGRYAIRIEKNPELIKLVKTACGGKARWNFAGRDWLIGSEDLRDALPLLRAASQAQAA